MLQQIANIANSACFPVKLGKSRVTAMRLAAARGRVRLFVVAVLISLIANGCRMTEKTESPSPANQPNSQATDVSAIHRRAIAIDMHADTPQRLLDEQVDLSRRLPDGHFDSVRAQEGGLDAQFFSIWVEPQLFGSGGPTAMKRADDQIAAVRALAEKHPETWQFATTAISADF